MKKILLLSLASLLSVSAWASRARSGIITMQQPDGSAVQVVLHGDEYYNYYTTPDGRPLVRMADGRFEPATWEDLHQQAWALSRQSFASTIDDYPSGSANPAYFPHEGEPKVCVILMEFPDKPFTYSREDIGEWLNGEQTQFESTTRSTSSVAGYFEFSSQGKFRPQFDVYGPYQTDSISSWYGYNQGASSSGKRLVSNALKCADPEVDFSQYDCYGDDGCLDLVYVIFSGQGANESGNKDQPWALSGTNSGLGTYDGVKAYRYGISNELIIGNDVVYQDGIGVFCHELSHTMGLPDLYDTSGKLTNWDNNGPEAWDLMDDGENLVNGMWPMPYTAWERDVFGWIELEELSATQQEVTLYPLNDAEGRGKAYKVVNPANPEEFYTFENIPEDGHYGWIGKYKAQGGMIVTHVNFIRSVFGSNRVNSTDGAPNLTILPADGYLLSSYSIGHDRELDGEVVNVTRTIYRSHLGGDPYPGANEVHAIESFHNYAGEEDLSAAISVSDIVRHDDGRITFSFVSSIDNGIAEVSPDRASRVNIFSVDGRCVGNDLSALPSGMYVVDGKIVRK